MVNVYGDYSQTGYNNPYAGNETPAPTTAAQADAGNRVGQRNRAAIGKTDYGGRSFKDLDEINAQSAASRSAAAADARYRTLATQATRDAQTNAARGEAYRMAQEAERKGEKVDYYVAKKAEAQGYVFGSEASRGTQEESRQTVPQRYTGEALYYTTPMLMNPSEGATFYVPYGNQAQTQINKAKAIATEGGQIDLYQTRPERPGFTPRYGFVTSSGGLNALQSGKFSVEKPLTPVVYSQESAGTKFAPGVNIAAANAVLANPKAFSRTGAELYGGNVTALDNRTITATTRVDPVTGVQTTVTNTPVSTYPKGSGNLAGLVDPFAVNRPKGEVLGNAPWKIDYGGSPVIQMVDQKGNLSPVPADRMAAVGLAAPSTQMSAMAAPRSASSAKPIESQPAWLPKGFAVTGGGIVKPGTAQAPSFTYNGKDYLFVPGQDITVPARTDVVNTQDIAGVNAVTGTMDTIMFNSVAGIPNPINMLTSAWRNKEWQQKTFGKDLNIATTTNTDLQTKGVKIGGWSGETFAGFWNKPVTFHPSEGKEVTTGGDADTLALGKQLDTRYPTLMSEDRKLNAEYSSIVSEGVTLDRIATNMVDEQGYWKGSPETLAQYTDRVAAYNQNADSFTRRSETHNAEVARFQADTEYFKKAYASNPVVTQTVYDIGEGKVGKSEWQNFNTEVGNEVYFKPVVSVANAVNPKENMTVERFKTNWENYNYNAELALNKGTPGSRVNTNIGGIPVSYETASPYTVPTLVISKATRTAMGNLPEIGVNVGVAYVGGAAFRAVESPSVIAGASRTAQIGETLTLPGSVSTGSRVIAGVKTYAVPVAFTGMMAHSAASESTQGFTNFERGSVTSRFADWSAIQGVPTLVGGIAGYSNPENAAAIVGATRNARSFTGASIREGGIRLSDTMWEARQNLAGISRGGGSQRANAANVGFDSTNIGGGLGGRVKEAYAGMKNRYSDIRNGVRTDSAGNKYMNAEWQFTDAPTTATTSRPMITEPPRLLTSAERGGGVGGSGGTPTKVTLPEQPTLKNVVDKKGSASSAKPVTLPVPKPGGIGEVMAKTQTMSLETTAPKSSIPDLTSGANAMTLDVGEPMTMRSMGMGLDVGESAIGNAPLVFDTPVAHPPLSGTPVTLEPPPLPPTPPGAIQFPLTPYSQPSSFPSTGVLPPTRKTSLSIGQNPFADIANLNLAEINMNQNVIPAGTTMYFLGDIGTGKQLWTTNAELAASTGRVIKYTPMKLQRGYIVGGANGEIILPATARLSTSGSATTIGQVPELSSVVANLNAASAEQAAMSSGEMGLMGMEGEGGGLAGFGAMDYGGVEYGGLMDIPEVYKPKTGIMPSELIKGKTTIGGTTTKMPWETSPIEETPLPKKENKHLTRMRAMSELIRTKKVGTPGNGAPYFRQISFEWMAARNAYAAEKGVGSQWKQVFPFEVLEGGLVPSVSKSPIGAGGKRFGFVNVPTATGTPRLMAGIPTLGLPAGGGITILKSASFRPHMGAPRLPGMMDVPRLGAGNPDFAAMTEGNAGMPRFGYRPGEAIPMGAVRMAPTEAWQPGGKLARKRNWLLQQNHEVLLGIDENFNTVFQKHASRDRPHSVPIGTTDQIIMNQRGVKYTMHQHLSKDMTAHSAGDIFMTGNLGHKGAFVVTKEFNYEIGGWGDNSLPALGKGVASRFRDAKQEQIDRAVTEGRLTEPKHGVSFWNDVTMETNIGLAGKRWNFGKDIVNREPTGTQMLQMFEEQPNAAEAAVRRHEARLGIDNGFSEDIAQSVIIKRPAVPKGTGIRQVGMPSTAPALSQARAVFDIDGIVKSGYINDIQHTTIRRTYVKGQNEITAEVSEVQRFRPVMNYNAIDSEFASIPKSKFSGEGKRSTGEAEGAETWMKGAIGGGSEIALVARHVATREMTGGLGMDMPRPGRNVHVNLFGTTYNKIGVGDALFDVAEGIAKHGQATGINLLPSGYARQKFYIDKRGFPSRGEFTLPESKFHDTFATGHPANPPAERYKVFAQVPGYKGTVRTAMLDREPVILTFEEDMAPTSAYRRTDIPTLDVRQTIDLTNAPIPGEEPSAIFMPAPSERFISLKPQRAKASAGSGNKWVKQQRMNEAAGKNLQLEKMQIHGSVGDKPTMSQMEGTQVSQGGMGGMVRIRGEEGVMYGMPDPLITRPPVVQTKTTLGGIGNTRSAIKVFDERDAARAGKQPEYYWGQLGAEKGVKGKWQFERMIEKQHEWEKARTGLVGIEKTPLHKLGGAKGVNPLYGGGTGGVTAPVRQGAGNPNAALRFELGSGLKVEQPQGMFPPMNKRRYKMYVESEHEYTSRIPPGMTRPAPQQQNANLAQMSGLGVMTESRSRQETILAERQKLRQEVSVRQEAGQLARAGTKSEVLAAQKTQLRAMERATQIAVATKLRQTPATATRTGTLAKTVPKTEVITKVTPISKITTITAVEPKLVPVPRTIGEPVARPQPQPRVEPRPEPRPSPLPIGGTPPIPPVGGAPFPFPLPNTPNAGGGEGTNWRSLYGFREHSPTWTPGEMAASLFTGRLGSKPAPQQGVRMKTVYGKQPGYFKTHSGTVKVIPLKGQKKSSGTPARGTRKGRNKGR